MSLLRGLIGGIAKGGADIVDNQIKRESEQEAERMRNEAAMAREQSMLRLRNTLENENRAAAAGRIDAATGKIADDAVAGKRALVGAGIADKSNWTPEQQAAVDQSIAMDRQAIVADPMTRVRAGGMTGDLRADQVATVELGERRADRMEKKDDLRSETENKRLDQQIKHQDATLQETIRHNKALENNAASRADKLSPAAKAQLEIASNGVSSAHKELSIAARSLDAAMKSGELDPEQKKATVAAAQAEFKAAKSAVDIANSHYNKVGQAHLGGDWKTIEADKPEDKPKPPPNAAALEFLKKNPGTRDQFIAKYGESALPQEQAKDQKPEQKADKPEKRPLVGDPVESKFQAETREMNDMKRTVYSPEVQALIDRRKAAKESEDKKNSDDFKARELKRSLNSQYR